MGYNCSICIGFVGFYFVVLLAEIIVFLPLVTSKGFHRFHGKFTIILFRGEASNTTIAKTHSLLRLFGIVKLPALPQSNSHHSIDVAM